MILYKYLKPDRLDVLEHRRIRFTQPGDLNDPCEFRPTIQGVASDAGLTAFFDANFERLVDQELTKFGALAQFSSQPDLKGYLLQHKEMVLELLRSFQPQLVQSLSPEIDRRFNQEVGVLCLSEVRDATLMWGHYTDGQQGFVIGLDSDHPFFRKRRGPNDEFGFLRQVTYQAERPKVVFMETTGADWLQTKSLDWVKWSPLFVPPNKGNKMEYQCLILVI